MPRRIHTITTLLLTGTHTQVSHKSNQLTTQPSHTCTTHTDNLCAALLCNAVMQWCCRWFALTGRTHSADCSAEQSELECKQSKTDEKKGRRRKRGYERCECNECNMVSMQVKCSSSRNTCASGGDGGGSTFLLVCDYIIESSTSSETSEQSRE